MGLEREQSRIALEEKETKLVKLDSDMKDLQILCQQNEAKIILIQEKNNELLKHSEAMVQKSESLI